METPNPRPDHGRAARAATLIATIDDLLPLTHPARPAVRELRQLFPTPNAELRDLLKLVPGDSLQQKANMIGVSKSGVRAMWLGKYVPSTEVYERILRLSKMLPDEKNVNDEHKDG